MNGHDDVSEPAENSPPPAQTQTKTNEGSASFRPSPSFYF